MDSSHLAQWCTLVNRVNMATVDREVADKMYNVTAKHIEALRDKGWTITPPKTRYYAQPSTVKIHGYTYRVWNVRDRVLGTADEGIVAQFKIDALGTKAASLAQQLVEELNTRV